MHAWDYSLGKKWKQFCLFRVDGWLCQEERWKRFVELLFQIKELRDSDDFEEPKSSNPLLHIYIVMVEIWIHQLEELKGEYIQLGCFSWGNTGTQEQAEHVDWVQGDLRLYPIPIAHPEITGNLISERTRRSDGHELCPMFRLQLSGWFSHLASASSLRLSF